MLAEVGTGPPRLSEQRTLEPVAPAAQAGREFVRAVCGRWGLAGLADPAALLANELVALAMTYAGTALELRVELHDAQLHVAVKDQDPDLMRFLAAKEETDRRLSLLVVDRVATAWGVRQDPAGGKTAWCALALPPMNGAGRGSSQAVGLPGSGLVASKLVTPAPRAGLIRRADLLSLLQASRQLKLCLVEAPAGSGKTTLLAQWQAAAGGGRVAWVSLDEGDNDPTRFWIYVVEALRTVEPGVGAAALEALRRPSADLLPGPPPRPHAPRAGDPGRAAIAGGQDASPRRAGRAPGRRPAVHRRRGLGVAERLDGPPAC
jgi:hypothetical protein